ncbi:MAG: DUF1761 domain-containing protein [Bacteroidetes bacterium]|nr:DUF1761 domain-containing protein [Bacteroidota bacterium]MCB0513629.1 DUF1761 domain-containing protein [Bacteroidota bacterium]
MTEKTIKMNYWAVLATGIMAFILSIIWYSPLIFGKIWEQYRNAPNPALPQWTMIFAPLRELIATFVLGILIIRINITDWKNAMKLMFILWLAFHAVGMAGAILWDNMQWKLGAVHAGDWLMKMLFIGIVLTIWFNRKSKAI